MHGIYTKIKIIEAQ